ncbi:YdcF family protein [Staphylococcus pseudintermedius]|nr:YdcF family protein [Staphylococcus pseudintermedius]
MTFTFLHHLPPVTRANIIVLGAGIYTEAVTPMLKARLDRAIALSRQLEKVHIIVSGGQGPDEPISEALAMQRYLIQQGIAPKQITMEDQSTNTRQNIYYSKHYLALHQQPHTIIVMLLNAVFFSISFTFCFLLCKTLRLLFIKILVVGFCFIKF